MVKGGVPQESMSKANCQDVDYVHAMQANLQARANMQEQEEAQRNTDGPYMAMAGPDDMRDWRITHRYECNFGPSAALSTLDKGDVLERKR